MKEIKVQITDGDYKRLLRIATLDAAECGDKVLYQSEEQKMQFGINFAIHSWIDSGEDYWGTYEEDY